MTTITTYNGITLLIVEIHHNTENLQIVSDSLLGDIPTGMVSYLSKDYLGKDYLGKDYEIIGTTSTLTEQDVEPFIECNKVGFYKDYMSKAYLVGAEFTKMFLLESFNSLLEANGIYLTKNFVVLQIKND